jgi:hypothetical protein
MLPGAHEDDRAAAVLSDALNNRLTEAVAVVCSLPPLLLQEDVPYLFNDEHHVLGMSVNEPDLLSLMLAFGLLHDVSYEDEEHPPPGSCRNNNKLMSSSAVFLLLLLLHPPPLHLIE